MKLLPFLMLLHIIYSVFADHQHLKSKGLMPTTAFQSKISTDFAKFGFKRGFEKALQPGISQFNPLTALLRICDSTGHGIINFSTRPTRCPVFTPKKVYVRNSVFYSFSASPIAPLAYSTTTRPTTAPMTHSAPAPVHVTPSYDAVMSSRSADSQPSNNVATTPRTRTAVPTSYSTKIACHQNSRQSPIPSFSV